MKYFIKLNIISALYAFMLFIAIELLLNVYRISRLAGWNMEVVTHIGIVIYIIGSILSTILFLLVAKKWMEARVASFWSAALWFPYFVLFIIIFASIFPICHQGDEANAGAGLIIMIAFMIYPIYIAVINGIGTGLWIDKEDKVG